MERKGNRYRWEGRRDLKEGEMDKRGERERLEGEGGGKWARKGNIGRGGEIGRRRSGKRKKEEGENGKERWKGERGGICEIEEEGKDWKQREVENGKERWEGILEGEGGKNGNYGER